MSITRRDIVVEALTASVVRLDSVLVPWGFAFQFDGVHSSHAGPYATGYYFRDMTRLSLSCRDEIDNLYYEQAFVRNSLCSRETEKFTVHHDTLMKVLGHPDDCRLIVVDETPNAIAARDGGDRVNALMFDLSNYAAPILRHGAEEFYAIVRQGSRSYSIEPPAP